MRAMARHAWIRTRTLLTSPADLMVLLLAAWSSLLLWPIVVPWTLLPTRSLRGPAGYFLLVFLILTLWLWSWIAARPLIGNVAHGGRTPASQTLPLPALPIGVRVRVIADAVTVLALLLLVRAVTLELLSRIFLVRDGSTIHFPRDASVVSSLAWYAVVAASKETTAAGCLLILPVFLAWMAPGRGETANFGRSFAVAAIGVSIHTALLGSSWPAIPLAMSLGLATLLLSLYATGSRGNALPVWHAAAHARPNVLSRPGLEPKSRFRRDRLEGLLRPMLVRVAPAVALLLGAFLLERFGGVPRVVYLLCLPPAAVLLISFYAAPFGINLFATDRAAGSASLLGGAYGRAWAGLPVRPDAVARAVYVHGLTSSLLAWLIWTGFTRLADRLALRGSLDLPLALAIPCAAGLLLCANVGDYWRGMLSALTIFSFLPAHVFTTIPLLKAEWAPRDAAALNFGVLLALAVLGGLPPLVHLRRSQRAA
jgi:hypothetical protein